MKKDNIIQEKSYGFALKIIKLHKYLSQEKKEYILSKQYYVAAHLLVKMLKRL